MFIPVGDDVERDYAPIPFSTLFFLGVCLAVFGYHDTLPQELYNRFFFSFGLVPTVLFHDARMSAGTAVIPAELTLVTSIFVHFDLMHLIGNMLFLWVFGISVENATGHFRFVLLFLLCGIGAGIGQALVDPYSVIPGVGASGAVSGILGAYILVYPYQRIRILYFLGYRGGSFYMSALVGIGLWIAMQMWSMITTDPTAQVGGVAWTAHVGGFTAGMILIVILRRRGVRLFDTRDEVRNRPRRPAKIARP